MGSEEYTPTAGAVCLYKEKGGVNWCLCKVVACYEGKVWLHNLSVGSMPVKNAYQVMFMELDSNTATLLRKGVK